MTTEKKGTKTAPTHDVAAGAVRPSEAMKELAEVLLGRWKITGDAHGETRYESADGGHFLLDLLERLSGTVPSLQKSPLKTRYGTPCGSLEQQPILAVPLLNVLCSRQNL